MVAKTDRQRAEACFAVARSTTHAGEREAAINRGLAVCKRANLDPATFDIPGRAKPQRKAAAVDWSLLYEDRTRSNAPPERPWKWASPRPQSVNVDLDEAIRRHQAHMADADFARDFREGMAQARAEDDMDSERVATFRRRAELRRQWPRERDAVDFLFGKGVPVYDLGEDAEPRWFAPTNPDVQQLDEWALRDLAQRTRSA